MIDRQPSKNQIKTNYKPPSSSSSLLGLEDLANCEKVKLLQKFDIFKIINPESNEVIGTLKEEGTNICARECCCKNNRRIDAAVVKNTKTVKWIEKPSFYNPKKEKQSKNTDPTEVLNSQSEESSSFSLNPIFNNSCSSSSNAKVLFKLQKPKKSRCFFNPACKCLCPSCVCQEGQDCAQSMAILSKNNEEIATIKQTLPMAGCARVNCCLSTIFPPFGLLAQFCTDFNLTVYDGFNNPKYILSNNISQATCNESCNNKRITIYAEELGNEKISGQYSKYKKAGSFIKRGKGIAKCTDISDDINIKFPKDATPELKAAIISAVILWYYNMWGKNQYSCNCRRMTKIIGCLDCACCPVKEIDLKTIGYFNYLCGWLKVGCVNRYT